ncbi:MAG: O-linked N-acetylglucosamine transferase, SPINDLY family protein [Leptolyngbyaceae cyanobacterium SM1_3_5]|nr:O-linked N-acetylglucosamine transferase, SPINDLY family protein [Leptolyngbyaceae cyanobacterium SM1_3_5]
MNAAATLDRSAEHAEALALFAQGNYADAAILWQQLAEAGAIAAYWHLGLALLLQEQEAEAQMVWMTPLLEADEPQAERWTIELSQVLSDEANRQATAENLDAAWLIRQHLRQLNAIDLPNLLVLLLLDLRRDPDAIDSELLDQMTALLPDAEGISPDLLLMVVRQLAELESNEASILACIEAIALHIPPESIVEILLTKAKSVFLRAKSQLAADLGKICVRLLPDNLDVLMAVIPMLQRVDGSEELWLSIRLGERCLAELPTLVDRVFAAQHLLTSLMTASSQHQRAIEVYDLYKLLLGEIAQSSAADADELGLLIRLLTCGLFCFYFEDKPRENRSLRNAIAALSQSCVGSYCDRTYVHLPRPKSKRLKIGYLSESLRQHSVGWLCRWLFKHHLNFDRVEVHLYSSRESSDPLQQTFKAEFGDRFHLLQGNVAAIADQIHQDEIDILVEMDSLTSFTDCGVAALKPAPVQLHWLGYDAAGFPTTDYFIADPYVLPDNAQDYYAEQIWRMPHTYIAVDGFEVSVPSLRRDQLDIPSEAIVYFSSQVA